MMHRGTNYQLWSSSKLSHRFHTEVLSDGTAIDVQARLSSHGVTQSFIGVYNKHGRPVFEEVVDCPDGTSLSIALVRGVDRARAIVAGCPVLESIHLQTHPSLRQLAV